MIRAVSVVGCLCVYGYARAGSVQATTLDAGVAVAAVPKEFVCML